MLFKWEIVICKNDILGILCLCLVDVLVGDIQLLFFKHLIEITISKYTLLCMSTLLFTVAKRSMLNE